MILQSCSFNSRLFFLLKDKILKMIYFSDGAASQYKHKKLNFLNFCHHIEDFSISAERHFSATSHGKGACDHLERSMK